MDLSQRFRPPPPGYGLMSFASPEPLRDERGLHPAAWGVALALHLGLAAVLLRPAQPPLPAGGGGGLQVGLSSALGGGAASGIAAMQPEDLVNAAPAESLEAAAASPAELPSPPVPQASELSPPLLAQPRPPEAAQTLPEPLTAAPPPAPAQVSEPLAATPPPPPPLEAAEAPETLVAEAQEPLPPPPPQAPPEPVRQQAQPEPVRQQAQPEPVRQQAQPAPVRQQAQPAPVRQQAQPEPVRQQAQPAPRPAPPTPRPAARAVAPRSALAGNPGPASATDSGPAGPPGPTTAPGPPGGGQGVAAASPGEGAVARQLPPAYAAALVRILQRNLRYPPAARAQGIEGTATVRFVIARDGTVQASQLVRGTGAVLLDHEAMALIRRVSPLPQLPADFPDAQAVVLAPIGFSIR